MFRFFSKGRRKKKLILHIGAHKTGSTAIQQLLTNNREAFQNINILVPEAGRPKSAPQGNHQLAWSMYGDKSSTNSWDDLKNEIQSSNARTIIISSEEFDRSSKDNVNSIKEHLSPFDTSVILYIRRQVDACEAFYRTIVEHYQETRDIHQFVSEEIQKHNCFNIIKNWSEFFSDTSMIIRLYQKGALVNGNVVDDFLHLVKIDKSGFEKIPGKNVNHGLPFAAISVIRSMNIEEFPRPVIDEFRLWSQKELANYDLNYHALSCTDTQRIMAHFAEQNRELRDRYFPGHPNALFDDSNDSARPEVSDFERVAGLKEKILSFFDGKAIHPPKDLVE